MRFFTAFENTPNTVTLFFYFLLCLSLTAFNALGSTFQIDTSVDESQRPQEFIYIGETKDPGWKLLPTPANQAGYSINRFSRFELDQDLNIFNLPSGNLSKTLIIKADDITLDGTVEIIGAPADLVFLSTKPNGRITCDTCRFENVNRVAFLVAEGDRIDAIDSESITDLGVIQTTANGFVSIGTLNAEGAVFVDILSRVLSLTGTIKTTLPAKKDSGDYIPHPQGEYTIASGTVDLKVGDIHWDFGGNTIKTIRNDGKARSLEGTIESAAVRLSISNLRQLHTRISTKADALATQSYNDQVFLAKEGIFIYTSLPANRQLSVNQPLTTLGKTHITADSDIYLTEQNNLQTGSLHIATTSNLYNESAIEAKHIEIATHDFINAGNITLAPNGQITVEAQGNIANRAGQIDAGDTGKIFLTAKNGFFRNGLAHISDLSDIASNRPVALSNCTTD